MILRPYGVVVSGSLELGVELVMSGGEIQEIRPHTGVPDPYVISPAFVNAHSHLEYRGLQGVIKETEYWPWIREITRLKQRESVTEVRESCLLAARENRATGVALIGEHSDRPFSGEALRAAGIGGIIFQEIITFFEREDRQNKLAHVRMNAQTNREAFERRGAVTGAASSGEFEEQMAEPRAMGPDHADVSRGALPLPRKVVLSPHALFTADPRTLKEIAEAGGPFSIHVAETPLESAFTATGTGDIAEFYRSAGIAFEPTGKDIVETLNDLGLARKGAQFVHCCAVSLSDIDLMARKGVKVAHCPRSNTRLQCPTAPVREMLDSGLTVGLGMDSAASAGPIDMFEEMRAAWEVSIGRGKPLKPEEIWRMATDMGADSLPVETPVWDVVVGSKVPLIKIHLSDALHVQDLIEQGSAGLVEWVEGTNLPVDSSE